MTVSEATALLVDTVADVALARSERDEARRDVDAWRLVALAAIRHGHDLHVECVRLRDRYHRLLDEHRQRRQEAA